MSGRIFTARHGEPAMDRTVRITAKQYGEWWANYDLAGLKPGQVPPDSLVRVAEGCDVVLSSTLPRAIETAAQLVGDTRKVPQDPMFVEAALPPPPIPSFVKLSPIGWGRVSRTFWFLGYAPNGVENHSAARRRVRSIADRLIEHATSGQSVLLCAHGYLNWMIDGHLKKRGWARVAHEGENNYWSWRGYRLRATRAQVVGQAATAE